MQLVVFGIVQSVDHPLKLLTAMIAYPSVPEDLSTLHSYKQYCHCVCIRLASAQVLQSPLTPTLELACLSLCEATAKPSPEPPSGEGLNHPGYISVWPPDY